VAAFIASTSATFVFHPLELIKTKLQVQDNECKGRIRYSGFMDACKTIWKLEGVKGFYYGLSPSLIGNGISWGSCLFIYRYIQSGPHKDTSFSSQMLAASAAGVLTTIATNPVWVIKNRLQIQTSILHSSHRYKSTQDAFRTIWRVEGVRGFYAGLGMSLASNSHTAVQLVLFDRLCDFVRSKWGGGFFTALAAGGTARLIASIVTYPLQTVRTRLQERPGGGLRYSGTKDAFITIYKHEGFKGFYRGFAVATARAIPQSAYTFAVMNFLLNKFPPLNT
jgi:solute carrier family 25 folate transporter 32